MSFREEEDDDRDEFDQNNKLSEFFDESEDWLNEKEDLFGNNKSVGPEMSGDEFDDDSKDWLNEKEELFGDKKSVGPEIVKDEFDDGLGLFRDKVKFDLDAPSIEFAHFHDENHEAPLNYRPKYQISEVGPNSTIYAINGAIYKARELLSIEPSKLVDLGPFMMFSGENEITFGNIHNMDLVHKKSISKLRTSNGTIGEVGISNLLFDTPEGIKDKIVKNGDGHSILLAKNFHQIESTKSLLIDILEECDKNYRFAFSKTLTNDISSRLKDKYGSLKNASHELNLNYSRIKSALMGRSYTVEEIKRIHYEIGVPDYQSPNFPLDVKYVNLGKNKKIQINFNQINEKITYLFGLVGSDGYVDSPRNSIGFYNKKIELIDAFENIIQTYFPESKFHKSIDDEDVYCSRITNHVLSNLIRSFKVKGNGIQDDEAFLPIFGLPKHLVSGFLSGYLDGDGYVKMRDKGRIIYTVKSEGRARNIQLLLKKLSINSRLQYRESDGTYGKSKVWDVDIYDKKNMLKFASHANSQHPMKDKRLGKLTSWLEDSIDTTINIRRAPIQSGEKLREVRKKLGLFQSDFGNSSTISQIESGKRRTSVSNFQKYIEICTQNGADDTMDEFRDLKRLISDDYIIDKISVDTLHGDFELIKISSDNKIVINNGLIV